MSTWTHQIDRAGNTRPMFAYFESESGVGASGANGQGTFGGLPVGVYDAQGNLKAPGGTADYIGAAAVPGVNTRPARMILRVTRDGEDVLYATFYPVETSAGVLNLNVALTAGQPLVVAPERLKTLEQLIADAKGATGPITGTSAQRKALAAPTTIVEYRETDTHRALTYYPGTGWRDVYGNDPDYVAPPVDDSGVI